MNVIDNFRGQYRFLSNFYPCVINYEGILYPSSEHAYQAAKTNDVEIREYIAGLKSPMLAKQAGKLVDKLPDWNDKSLDIMYDVCYLKFEQEPFKTKLIETGDALLVEGNTWGDTFWGVCNDVGENHLGRILMKIRTEMIVSDIIRQEIDNEILEALKSR